MQFFLGETVRHQHSAGIFVGHSDLLPGAQVIELGLPLAAQRELALVGHIERLAEEGPFDPHRLFLGINCGDDSREGFLV